MAREEVKDQEIVTEQPEKDSAPEQDTKPEEEIFYGKNEEKNEKTTEKKDGGSERVDAKEKEEVKKEDGILEKPKEKTDDKPEEISLEIPKNSLLSVERANEIKAYAKEQGLSKEVAQHMLNSENQLLTNYVTQFQPGGPAWTKIESAFREKAMSDPVVGGTDENLNKSVSLAEEAMDTFLNADEKKEMQTLLHNSGYGSHPVILKMLRKAGEIIANDKIEQGRTVERKKPKTPGEVFWGTKDNT